MRGPMNPIVDLFVKDGPLMWPILLCLLGALVVVVERWLWWWQLGRRRHRALLAETFTAIARGRFAEAARLSDDPRDPFLATVKEGLTHAHSSLLGAMQLRATDEIERAERRLWILGTLFTLAAQQ